MKKAIIFLLSAALLAGACQKYDDSVLKNRIGDLENRVTSLEATVNTLNGNVSSVQTLVQALQDDITISVISKNKDGFTITFSDGQSVEIQNGEKGSQGDKGDTPVIGVKADGDVFYWTADGEWLVDASGNKVAVSGGIPTLKIENDHWYASYDGTTWQDLGEVDVMGGSTDLSITEDDNFVYFAFKSTGETIKISKSTRFTIDIEGTDYVLLDGKRVEIPYSIFGADGTERLFIQGNGFTTSYDASKIYVTPNEGVIGGDVLVYAVRNSDQRMCGVVLSFGEGVFTVTEAAKIPAAGGDVSVTVRTNLTYEVVIPEEAQSWLSVAVSTKAAVREDAVTFTAQPNEGAARTAAVTLKAQGAATLTVTVYQEGKGGSTPDGVKAVSVSEFLAAAESDSQVYELVGVIGGSINTTYGNFDLTDDSGTVYVYGLTATDLGYGEKNDKSFASLDLNKGDTIKLHGYRGSYTNPNTGETKDEVMYAWFIEKIASGDSGQGGEGGGGEATGDFASNVEWTSGSDGAYNEKATVNGTDDVPLLKLGTSKATGTSTLTLPAGSTSLTFYALSWKGKPSKLVFYVGGKEVGSVEPDANDGLSNNSPYTLTVSSSDMYTVTFPATSSVTVETSGSNTRAALFGIQAK